MQTDECLFGTGRAARSTKNFRRTRRCLSPFVFCILGFYLFEFYFWTWIVALGVYGCWVAPSGEQQVSVCWCVAWRHILHLTTRLTHHRLGRSHQILGLMVIHAFDSHTSVIVQRKSLFCSVNAIIVFLSNKSVNDLIPVVQSSSGSIKTNFVP